MKGFISFLTEVITVGYRKWQRWDEKDQKRGLKKKLTMERQTFQSALFLRQFTEGKKTGYKNDLYHDRSYLTYLPSI